MWNIKLMCRLPSIIFNSETILDTALIVLFFEWMIYFCQKHFQYSLHYIVTINILWEK